MRIRRTLFGAFFSIAAAALLLRLVDLPDLRAMWKRPVISYVAPFAGAVALMVLIFAYRWRALLGNQISLRSSVAAALISLGGNMLLPARGGDLLRLHSTHKVAHIPVAVLFSRLFLEKIIDLMTLAVVGLSAALWLGKGRTEVTGGGVLLFTSAMLLVVAGFLVLLRNYCGTIIRLIRPIFRLARREALFERHVVHVLMDASDSLVFRILAWPMMLTVAMWLSAYAGSYMFVAGLVGLQLSYPEALFVLYAGALGLLLPAAPSGVGTFHASIVSAFVLLRRPASEGLILATAIHALLFVSFAAPAGVLYGRFLLKSRNPS